MSGRFKKYFIPSAENDYTPDLLQRSALFLMALLAITTFFASNFYATLWQKSGWLVAAVLPAVIVENTNQERVAESLPSLTRNSVLDAAARLKAQDMAENSYFAHYSPAGVSPWHWFEVAGYEYENAGENLAVYFTDSAAVVDAWMDSPTHKANIVNSKYQEIGVGTAKGVYDGHETVFVVQFFGSKPEAVADTEAVVATAPRVVEPAVVTLPTNRVVESVVITETKAEESPLMVAEVVSEVVQDESLLSDMVPPEVSEEPEQTFTETVAMQDTGVVLAANDEHETADVTWGAVTSPSKLLQMIYLLIGLLTAAALFASVVVEWRVQRAIGVVYGVGLLLMLGVLFSAHLKYVGAVIIT
jgi:uncharacterized protein YkwD